MEPNPESECSSVSSRTVTVGTSSMCPTGPRAGLTALAATTEPISPRLKNPSGRMPGCNLIAAKRRAGKERRAGNPFSNNIMSNELQQRPKAVLDIRAYLDDPRIQAQIARVLPQHMTPDRFARIAITAITKTPKLMDCSRETLLRCLMDCSALGLEPDGRHAHLIPYGKDCTLIIDYKGLIALARRSGSVSLFKAELVKENDVFRWDDNVVQHSIDWMSDRGKTAAVYSFVKFKDGAADWEVMTLAEVEAIRKRSRAGNGGPWVTDFDEMAKKTVIRRHSKRLTLSPEFERATEFDDDRLEERNVTPRAAARREPLNPFAPPQLPEALPEGSPEWDDREGGDQ